MNLFAKKLLVAALAVPSFAFAQASLDKVVAVVGGEPITAQEVQDKISVNVAVLNKQAGKEVKLTEAQKNQITQGSFTEVIKEHVLRNQAGKSGVSVSQSDVDAAVASIAKNQGLTVEDLKQRVSAGNAKAWSIFQNDIKTELLTNKLVQKEVVDKVKVTPEEVETFLSANKMGANNPIPKHDYVSTLHLFASKEKDIKEAQAAIAKGKAFEDLAAQPETVMLDDESANAEVRKALRDTSVGSTTNVVKTKAGFHLFKVTKKDMQQEFTLEQQRAAATETLKVKKTEAAYKTWFEGVMTNAEKNNLIEIKK